MKVCKICQLEKENTEFYKQASGTLFTSCKQCTKERNRQYKQAQNSKPRIIVTEQEKVQSKLEQLRQTTKALVENRRRRRVKEAEYNKSQDIRKKILYRTKVRARAMDVPFNLTYTDIVVPDHCPVLGIKLEVSDSGPKDNSPSIDRILPILGYTVGNIQIISNKANRMKSNADPEELVKFAKWILKTFTKE